MDTPSTALRGAAGLVAAAVVLTAYSSTAPDTSPGGHTGSHERPYEHVRGLSG